MDMSAKVQGAEDLLRVGRSRGDFPGNVPQMEQERVTLYCLNVTVE